MLIVDYFPFAVYSKYTIKSKGDPTKVTFVCEVPLIGMGRYLSYKGRGYVVEFFKCLCNLKEYNLLN